jgi:serine/threonine protein phosphatase PrpC
MFTVDASPILISRAVRKVEEFHSPLGFGVVFTQRSPDKPTPNEDSAMVFQLSDDHLVLAVADGCGGMEHGEKASRLALRVIAKTLAVPVAQGTSLRNAILDGIEEANQRIIRTLPGAGCTMAIVEVQQGTIRSYHVGDSKILIVNEKAVRYESICHSPVGYAVESGMMKPLEAMFHADLHLVSNILGQDQMRIDIGPTLTVDENDRIVIASDGLFDNVGSEEIVKRLTDRSIVEGIAKVTRLASRRMREDLKTKPSKPDDLTVVAFQPKARD